MPHLLSRSELVAWMAALAVAWTALAFTGYRSRDPDSVLHTSIEADQLARPPRAWIAPEWAGHWTLEGLYREHPVGTFIPPVLLAKLGFPAHQAGYAVNAVYQVLGLLLIARLAACFVPRADARSLLWLLQLIPIAFTYRIRANHEQAVLFFLIAALYGTERSRREHAWAALTVAAVLGMMLVKGVFAVLVPPSCALWLLASRAWRRRGASDEALRAQAGGTAGAEPGDRRQPAPSDAWAWAGIGLSVMVAAIGAAVYEYAYRQVTGASFLAEYLRRQLGIGFAQKQSGPWVVAQKLRNLFFYVIRLAWFAFPWSLVLAFVPWRRHSAERRAVASVNEHADGPVPGHDRALTHGRARGALLGVLAVTALWLAAFSLSDRLADRFIFPAYYIVGAGGALLALQSLPALGRRIVELDRRAPLIAPALWLALFFLQLLSPRLGLPFINR